MEKLSLVFLVNYSRFIFIISASTFLTLTAKKQEGRRDVRCEDLICGDTFRSVEVEGSYESFSRHHGAVRRRFSVDFEIFLLIFSSRNYSHFSDINAKAMDTTWFKRAIDQHNIEPDSFVYSVPFDSGYNGKNSSVLVTAAHSIFIEHRGHKAAAGVIGLQYTHETLAAHFINITSSVSGHWVFFFC